jgi:hypothetical protein
MGSREHDIVVAAKRVKLREGWWHFWLFFASKFKILIQFYFLGLVFAFVCFRFLVIVVTSLPFFFVIYKLNNTGRPSDSTAFHTPGMDMDYDTKMMEENGKLLDEAVLMAKVGYHNNLVTIIGVRDLNSAHPIVQLCCFL